MLKLILNRGLNVLKASLLSIFLTAVLVFLLPATSLSAESCQDLFTNHSNLNTGASALYKVFQRALRSEGKPAPTMSAQEDIKSIADLIYEQRLNDAKGNNSEALNLPARKFAKVLKTIFFKGGLQSKATLHQAASPLGNSFPPINLQYLRLANEDNYSVVIKMSEQAGLKESGQYFSIIRQNPQDELQYFVKDFSNEGPLRTVRLKPYFTANPPLKTFRVFFEDSEIPTTPLYIDAMVVAKHATLYSPRESQLFEQLTHDAPDAFKKDLRLGNENFKEHAAKHVAYRSTDKVLDYAIEIDQFLKDQSPEVVYLNLNRRQFKFNPTTGQFLAVGKDGFFVSYFVMRGLTEEARMKRFLNRVAELMPSY